MFKVGDCVRHSGYSLRSLRDWWLSAGRHEDKVRRKDAFDAKCAERGTVTALLPADPSRGVSAGVEVTWQGGSISRGLSHMVEKA